MSAAAKNIEPLLQVKDLRKNYGNLAALAGVDFSLAPGEFLTLLGPSGSGKTTTLMSVAGFVEPSAGDILLRGQSISKTLPEARGFGMVFQGYALFPHMTVAENVRFPLTIRGKPASDVKTRAAQALEQVQLSGFADRYPKQLSGGQQQRVALARALVYQPEILLLDEPLSALDKKLRADLQWELRTINKTTGTSFLYVTHDQEEALSMSDRIAIFNQGKIVQIGTPRELYEQPCNLFVSGFLGRSNVLDATVIGDESGRLTLQYEGGIIRVDKSRSQLLSGSAASLVVRPHKISLSTDTTQGFPACVEAVGYVGNVMNYKLTTGAGTVLFAEQMVGSSALPLSHGCNVGVVLNENDVTVLEAQPR